MQKLFSEHCLSDIVTTTTGDSVRFRLPTQRFDRAWWRPRFVACLLGAMLVGLMTVHATWLTPKEDREVGVLVVCAFLVLVLVLGIWLVWRYSWHYEVYLTPMSLRVDCITSWNSQNLHEVALGPIRQLTLTRLGQTYLLQAESAARMIDLVGDYDQQLLLRLAQLLCEHRSRLLPLEAAMQIAVETPLRGACRERTQQPLNSKIVLTNHAGGITLDFPVPTDPRRQHRQTAGHALRLAIFLSLGAVIWWRLCRRWHLPDLLPLSLMAGFVGVLALVAAFIKAHAGMGNDRTADCLRQLGFIDNLLIRITKNGHKRLWYRQEIASIAIEVSSNSENEWLSLVLHQHTGEKTALIADVLNDPGDYRPRAELEWIATLLQQALQSSNAEPPASARPVIENIQDRSSYRALADRGDSEPEA